MYFNAMQYADFHQNSGPVEGGEKEGFLNKTSIKATKRTNTKKRWCTIRNNCFFYSTSHTVRLSSLLDSLSLTSNM